MSQAQQLRDALEYAPKTNRKIAAGLIGWWTTEGWFVCSSCADRIMHRGCAIPSATPVWADADEPFGVCCCCEKGAA